VLCVYFPFIFSFHIRWLPSFPTRRSSDLQPNGNYVVNGLNQYTQRNGVNFEYDDSGNLTFDGTTRFLYDQENRLVKATNSNGTLKVELWYDPLGDRKSTRLNSSHVKISYAVFCLKK